MQFTEFLKSLESDTPPPGLTLQLKALWLDGKGDWHAAHASIDSIDNKDAYWVHAYLHRKEGDIWNADYWYRRAGKTRPAITLQEEWVAIAKALLPQNRYFSAAAVVPSPGTKGLKSPWH